MSVDFFEAKCKSTTNKSLFGLCDNEDNSPAFIDFTDKSKWIATVYNSMPAKDLVFIAIDNCIDIYKKDGSMDPHCDCMLTYSENIVFVELKNKVSDWISEGMHQIEITLKNFRENHNLSEYKHKRAFVANKRHPNFHVIQVEAKRKFWDNYRVRINIDAEIKI